MEILICGQCSRQRITTLKIGTAQGAYMRLRCVSYILLFENTWKYVCKRRTKFAKLYLHHIFNIVLPHTKFDDNFERSKVGYIILRIKVKFKFDSSFYPVVIAYIDWCYVT